MKKIKIKKINGWSARYRIGHAIEISYSELIFTSMARYIHDSLVSDQFHIALTSHQFYKATSLIIRISFCYS